MSGPDWSLLTPAHRQRWEQLERELEDEQRKQTIVDLRFVRELKKTITRDALLNDVEPEGLEACDEMIEQLMERLL